MMKTIRLATKTSAIAILLLTTNVAQATSAPTTAVEVLWQWVFPDVTQSELKHCPAYPRCGNVLAPKPESTKSKTKP